MATIDLGKIKLVWKGTYNNSTAYTVDDIVEYTDGGILSTYICTTNSQGNAPSSGGTAHSSWAYMSKGSVQGGLTSHVAFESSGTWTKPAGITKVRVTVTGGGGGGGSGNNANNQGGGGGAGGTAIEIIDVSSVSTVAVTVGAGGAGGASQANGSSGGTSSFGNYCSATGGTGGRSGQGTRCGGGVGSNGDLNFYGGDGNSASGGGNTDEPVSGTGGSSYWGGGGGGATSGASGSFTDTGYSAQCWGAGGGGGDWGGTGSVTGGSGKHGVVYVEEFK